MWGAWIGDRARVQYIGKADRKPFAHRFRRRYADELRIAHKYGAALRDLPESFPIRTVSTRVERYSRLGLQRPKRSTRPPRAERYAKIGLDNLWYYFIPAPGEARTARDEDLDEIETALIQLENTRLFAAFERGERRAFPLLNQNKLDPGKFLSDGAEIRHAYWGWVRDGSWWEEMDEMCRRGAV